jgi:hypothetical protein
MGGDIMNRFSMKPHFVKSENWHGFPSWRTAIDIVPKENLTVDFTML